MWVTVLRDLWLLSILQWHLIRFLITGFRHLRIGMRATLLPNRLLCQLLRLLTILLLPHWCFGIALEMVCLWSHCLGKVVCISCRSCDSADQAHVLTRIGLLDEDLGVVSIASNVDCVLKVGTCALEAVLRGLSALGSFILVVLVSYKTILPIFDESLFGCRSVLYLLFLIKWLFRIRAMQFGLLIHQKRSQPQLISLACTRSNRSPKRQLGRCLDQRGPRRLLCLPNIHQLVIASLPRILLERAREQWHLLHVIWIINSILICLGTRCWILPATQTSSTLTAYTLSTSALWLAKVVLALVVSGVEVVRNF